MTVRIMEQAIRRSVEILFIFIPLPATAIVMQELLLVFLTAMCTQLKQIPVEMSLPEIAILLHIQTLWDMVCRIIAVIY